MYELAKKWEEDGLTGLLFEPIEEKPKRILFLLHGYQGDALSNAPFGYKLFTSLKETVVVIPDGIDSVPNQPQDNKRQWWNLTNFDGNLCSFMSYFAPKKEQELLKQMQEEATQTAKRLNQLILRTLHAYGLSLNQCFLIGISQGGITAFEMVLFNPELLNKEKDESLGGLISIGSGIMRSERLCSLPPYSFPKVSVLLLRGRTDEIFPKTVDYFTKSHLESLGFSTHLKEVDSGHYGLEHHTIQEISYFIDKNT